MRCFAITMILLLALATPAVAEEFSYQGRLTEGNGKPVDGPVAMRVSFFRTATGGDPVLTATEGLESVPLQEGIFQIKLTLASADYNEVFAAPDQPVYVQITDMTHAPDKPYARFQVSTLPYASKVPVDGKSVFFGDDGKLRVGPAAAAGAGQFLTKDAQGALVWATPAGAAASIAGGAVGGGTPANGQILKFTGGQWQAVADAGVNRSGDTGLGSLALGPLSTLGLGNYTTAQETVLTGTLGIGDKGKAWFNSSTNQMRYWDGTAASTVGASGAGIASFNGATGNAQTLPSPTTTGTTFDWTTDASAGTHTLNIPLAATSGATAGLLSHSDYAAFSDKLDKAGGAMTGDLTTSGNIALGTATAGAELDIRGNLSSALTGTVTVGAGSSAVTGTGTAFLSELAVGRAIKIATQMLTVAAIGSNTSLTLSAPHTAGATGVTAYRDPTLLRIKDGAGVVKATVDPSGQIGVGTSAPHSLLEVAGPIATAVGSQTSNYALTVSDSVLTVDATAAAVTVTLPTAANITGRRYTVKKIDATAHAVTLSPFMVEQIDGDTSYGLTKQYDVVSVISDGASWLVDATTSKLIGNAISSGTIGGSTSVNTSGSGTFSTLAAQGSAGTVATNAAGDSLSFSKAGLSTVVASNAAGSLGLGVNGAASAIAVKAGNTQTSINVDGDKVAIGTTATPGSRLEIRGVGTTSATSALNVTKSDGTSSLFVRDDGNVGIDTSSPASYLHVSAAAAGDVSTEIARFTNTAITTDHTAFILVGKDAGTAQSAVVGHLYSTTPASSGAFLTNRGDGVNAGVFVLKGGNVGIGTSTPSARLQVQETAAASTRETLAKFSVSDAGNDAFRITNGTNGDSRFSPVYSGYVDSYNSAYSTGMWGLTNSANDATDSSTFGLVHVAGMIASNAADPTNSTLTSPTKRKIFTVGGAGTSVMLTVAASGNVGIGTATPSSLLDVSGTIRSMSQTIPTTGAGTEIVYNAGKGFVTAYDRTNSTYMPLYLTGSTLLLNGTAGGNVGIGTATPTSKLQVAGPIATAVASKVFADSPVSLGASDSVVTVNASGGGVVVNLPTAASITGRRYTVKKTDSSANAVTVTPFGVETIDGATTFALAKQNQAVTVLSDGASWQVEGTTGKILGDAITSGTIGGSTSVSTSGSGTFSALTAQGSSGTMATNAAGDSLSFSKAGLSTVVASNAAGSLGLGVNGAASAIAIKAGNTQTSISIDGDKVAIGTTATPGSRLEIRGVGTTSATSALNVTKSDGTSNLFVRDDGNVGIGTTAPGFPLQVNGSMYSQTSAGGSTGVVRDYAGGAMAAGDSLGTVGFVAVNMAPSVNPTAASVGGAVDATSGSPTRTKGRLLFNTSDGTNVVERARIDSAGNFGIGTTVPAYPLDVGGVANVTSLVQPLTVGDKISLYGNRLSGTGMYGFGVEAAAMYYKTGGAHRWYTGVNADAGASTKMELDATRLYVNGNVGIGTATPAAKLHVYQTAAASTRESLAVFNVSDSGNDSMRFTNGTSGDGKFAPSFNGYVDSYNSGYSFGISGMTNSTNDASDSSIYGLVNILGLVTSSATDPMNGTLTAPTKRKVLTVGTTGTPMLTVAASGFVGIGTGAPTSALQVAGARSASAWGTTGLGFSTAAATYTDTSTAASGTAANAAAVSIGQPTFAATNTGVIDTNAISTYIAGPPLPGTNTTFTNAYSLYVDGPATTATTAYGLYVKEPTGGTGNVSAYFKGPTNASYIKDGLIFAVGLANTSTSNNALIQTAGTGTVISRNIADANVALIVRQASAGSTGDILQVKNNTASALVVQQAGNVGIGFDTPATKLAVNGTGYFADAVSIGAASATASYKLDAIGNGRFEGSLCVKSTTGACAGTTAGTIYADTTTVAAADLAEHMPVDDASLVPGDIVAISGPDAGGEALFTKADRTHAGRVLGVVSTRPGVALGSDTPGSKPVALAGRVPVNVTLEGGPIAIGDYLVAASTPGKAKRAQNAADGVVIGIALSAYDGTPAKTLPRDDGIAHASGHQVMMLVQAAAAADVRAAAADAKATAAAARAARAEAQIVELKEDSQKKDREIDAIKSYICQTQPEAAFCAP